MYMYLCGGCKYIYTITHMRRPCQRDRPAAEAGQAHVRRGLGGDSQSVLPAAIASETIRTGPHYGWT